MLAPDGFGRIVFPKADGSGVDFVQCTNTSCSSASVTTISSPYTQGVSVAMPADGNAEIESAALDYIRCSSADCSSYDDEAISGAWNGVLSLALGLDAFPRMMAQDTDNIAYQVTKRVPTSLKFLSAAVLQTGNQGDHGCLAGYYGIMLDIKYQVLDQQTPAQAIQDATMVPHEHDVWYDGTTDDKDIGPSYVSTSSHTTRSDGTFDDAPLGLCKFVPFNTPYTSSQDITILWKGQSYSVRHNDWQFSSTNLINHGTVTNGNDVNVTQ